MQMQVVGILKEMVETTMESYEGFRISEGKKVYIYIYFVVLKKNDFPSTTNQ